MIMLEEIWIKVSYMVQLITACFIFMQPLQKKEGYPFRIAAGAVILLTISFVLNHLIIIPETGIAALLYWMLFWLLCFPYVRFCILGNKTEVIYCVICASAMQHATCNLYIIFETVAERNFLVFLLTSAVLYSLFYQFIVRKLAVEGHYVLRISDVLPLTTIVLFVLLLSILENTIEVSAGGRILYFLSDSLCCFYILWEQASQREKLSLQRELDGIQHVWNQQKAQYEMTQETIDTINRKCHDLRHQLRALCQTENGARREQYLREIENVVMIYDSAVQTGNTALDTVLMEKSLFCKNHGIQCTCMVDGSWLNKIEPGDICAIFGNAIDNAIDAVQKLSDPSRRIITLRMLIKEQLLVIQVRNYYEGELKFENGLPKTTQADCHAHGYGMKSIQYTVEKYHGSMTICADSNIFTLQLLLPAAEASENATICMADEPLTVK